MTRISVGATPRDCRCEPPTRLSAVSPISVRACAIARMPRSRPPCPDLARDAGEALPGFDAGLGRDTRARDARASESQHAGAAGRRRRRQGHASWRRFEARPAPRRPKRRARPAARPASASVCPQRERRRRAPVAGRCRWPASSLGWRRTSRRATRRRRFRRVAGARAGATPLPPPPRPRAYDSARMDGLNGARSRRSGSKHAMQRAGRWKVGEPARKRVRLGLGTPPTYMHSSILTRTLAHLL